MTIHTIATTSRSKSLRSMLVVLGMLLVAGTVAILLANLLGLAGAPSPTSGVNARSAAAQEQFYAFKLRQADERQFAPRQAIVPAVSAARERYETFKLRQAEQRQATPKAAPGAALAAARERYETFKLQQAQSREWTGR